MSQPHRSRCSQSPPETITDLDVPDIRLTQLAELARQGLPEDRVRVERLIQLIIRSRQVIVYSRQQRQIAERLRGEAAAQEADDRSRMSASPSSPYVHLP